MFRPDHPPRSGRFKSERPERIFIPGDEARGQSVVRVSPQDEGTRHAGWRESVTNTSRRGRTSIRGLPTTSLLPNFRKEKGDIADGFDVPIPARERFPESLLDF